MLPLCRVASYSRSIRQNGQFNVDVSTLLTGVTDSILPPSAFLVLLAFSTQCGELAYNLVGDFWHQRAHFADTAVHIFYQPCRIYDDNRFGFRSLCGRSEDIKCNPSVL